ncbi:MAG TPA: MerR family transcriptional regulator, partial [Actinomycetota bacterium]|nr:MerR family transcriptional regulator [Actinomycetota bacterium]
MPCSVSTRCPAPRNCPCAFAKAQVTAWKVRAITRRVGVVGYRVEQLAAACDVSVDTIRYYQSKGLLPPPKREGRVAIYDREHLQR